MDEESKLMDKQSELMDKESELMDKESELMDKESELTKDKRLREEGNQSGREKELTSEPVSTSIENIHRKLDSIENMHRKLDSMIALLQESLPRTRVASTINVDDLHVLRSCLDIAPVLEEEDVSLISLLGAENEGGESLWDGDTCELQLKDEYIQQFKKMTACWDVRWNDANEMKIKTRFSNLEFPVVVKNDLVLSLRRFGSSLISYGAILGVEIKRKLSWRGLREAEVEFYVWASESLFPFVQLITDMERGGVAIYSNTGYDVRFRTLGSMEAVRNFVIGLVKSLPPGAGEDDSEDGFINPDTFLSPSRKRFSSGSLRMSLRMSSANPQGGNSSTVTDGHLEHGSRYQ